MYFVCWCNVVAVKDGTVLVANSLEETMRTWRQYVVGRKKKPCRLSEYNTAFDGWEHNEIYFDHLE
jgi:hypothetical protein